MSAFLRNLGQVSRAESIPLSTRGGRRKIGGKLFRNIGPFRAASTAATSGIIALGADFDGTNDYMSIVSLTGEADGSQGIVSFWYRIDGGDGTSMRALCTADNRVNIVRLASNLWNVQLASSNGSQNFIFTTIGTYLSDAAWHHFYASWDTNFGAASKLKVLKIDGVSDAAVDLDLDIAFNVDYTQAYGIGARSEGTGKFNGCLSEFYFSQAAYSTDETKFRSGAGKPISLGADGSTPTGAQPIIYQRIASGGAATDFATNLGSGGNFSITGSLDLSSTNPSD